MHLSSSKPGDRKFSQIDGEKRYCRTRKKEYHVKNG
jgi:hypothetical protein